MSKFKYPIGLKLRLFIPERFKTIKHRRTINGYKCYSFSKKLPTKSNQIKWYTEDLISMYINNSDLQNPNNKYIPKIWNHAVSGWKYSKDCNCFYRKDIGSSMPTEFCLGDRYIHANFGLDSYGICWAGSTSSNWHGGYQGNDLGKALRWVKQAKFKSFGCVLWSSE